MQAFFRKIMNDNTGAYAAQLSYFLIMAFIPFVMLLAVGITHTPLQEDVIREVLYDTLPADFYAVVLPIIRDIFTRSAGVLPISLIMALWSSGKVIHSLTLSLNIIYQVRETRGYLLNRLRGMLYMIVFLLAIMLSMIFMVFGNILKAFLLNMNPNLTGITSVFALTEFNRNLITGIALFFIFVVIYVYIPNRRASWRSQIPGAMVAAVMWLVYSWVFSLYVNMYNGLSSTYGSLTTLILFLTWLYFCMWIVLIGAHINAFFEVQIRKLRQKQLERKERKRMLKDKKKEQKNKHGREEVRDKDSEEAETEEEPEDIPEKDSLIYEPKPYRPRPH